MNRLLKVVTITALVLTAASSIHAGKADELKVIKMPDRELDERVLRYTSPLFRRSVTVGPREKDILKHHMKLYKLLDKYKDDSQWRLRYVDDAVVIGEVLSVRSLESYTYGTEVILRVERVVRGGQVLKGRKKGTEIAIRQVNGRLVSPQERLRVYDGIEFEVGERVLVGLSTTPSKLFYQLTNSPSPPEEVREAWFYKTELSEFFEVGLGGVGVRTITDGKVWWGANGPRRQIPLSSAIGTISDGNEPPSSQSERISK